MVVPSSSLSEYSVRSLMSLEGRDPDSDEAKCLKNYIRWGKKFQVWGWVNWVNQLVNIDT